MALDGRRRPRRVDGRLMGDARDRCQRRIPKRRVILRRDLHLCVLLSLALQEVSPVRAQHVAYL